MSADRLAFPKSLPWLLLAGALPAVAFLLAEESQRQRVFQSLDLPLSAAALGLAAVLFLVLKRFPPLPGMALAVLPLLALPPVLAGALAMPTPVSNDEVAYLFQAELMADGKLSQEIPAPLPARSRFYMPLHRRQVMEDHQEGRRFAKYPPGTSLALVPGQWLAWPYLSVFLAGLLDLFLIWKIAKLLKLPRPEAAVWLLALSPFFLLVQTSFQSEVFSLPAALAGWLALLHLGVREAPGKLPFWALGAAVGAASGWIFCVRPLTGVVFALACLPGFWIRSWKRPEARWPALAGAVLGGLPFLGLSLAYSAALTGDALLAPYAAYAQTFGPFDAQGQPVDVYGKGDFFQGLWRQAGRWSVAFGGILGLAAVAFAGLWRSRRIDGGSALAFSILLPLAYAFHWYPGHWAYLGPLYAYEALGFMVLGFLFWLQSWPTSGRRVVLWLMLFSGPLLAAYRFLPMREHGLKRAAPQRVAAEQAEDHAVILLPLEMGESGFKLFTPSSPPFPAGEQVFLRELANPERTWEVLQFWGLEQRPVYRYRADETLEAWSRP
ncbi:MAG: hypothetical protein DWQ01_04055 [Planctomycetota bacterium]|nr:MAG: hypothetical protein DWQ01_04055 [Planctomycetota bacterium]